MVGLRGRLRTGPSRSLAGVVAAIILGACAVLPATSPPAESASPAPTASVVISPSPVPTESLVPTDSQTPTASPTRIATLAPTATPNPTDSPVPTATPLAALWRLHTMLASKGRLQEAYLYAETFLTDGRVLALWADLLDWELAPWALSSLYNPQTDTWTELVPPWDYQGYPPGPLSVVGLADGSAIAVLSSLDDHARATTQSALFDPEQGAWLPPVDVPIDDPISAHDAVMLGDGRVLMFGVGVTHTYLFDPATDSWDPGPTLPFDNPASAAVLDDGSVLALARDGHAARLPAGGTTWLRSGRAPVGDDAYVIAIPGGAVALGGTVREWTTTGPVHKAAVYRADTDRWSPGPDPPPVYVGPGSHSIGVLLADDRVLVAGGQNERETDYSCRQGAAILSVDTLAWQLIEPMPACLGYGPGIGQLRADGTVLIVGEGMVDSDEVDMGIGIVTLSYVP